MEGPSFIKKIASYFSEFLVEEVESDLNGKLEVYYQYGHYVLNSEKANYSFQNLHRVFQRGLVIVAKRINPGSIMNLGMGAGSTLDIMRNDLGWNAPILSIEHDPKVVELSRRYFKLDIYSNHQYHVADALQFLIQNDKKYDLILVDLFKDLDVPEKFLQENFIMQLHSHLTDPGIVLFNFVCQNSQQKKKLEDLRSLCNQLHFDCEEIMVKRINRLFILKKSRSNQNHSLNN